MSIDAANFAAQHQIERDGFAVLANVFPADLMQRETARLETALQASADKAGIRSRNGRVYAARNLLDFYPTAADLPRSSERLRSFLQRLMGADAGVVRGLYFDKPPEQSWSLPWHQDRTIAVEDNQLASQRFRNPTRKAEVPHVEADDELLASMLTVRIHLDDASAANGALRVLPGSHDWSSFHPPENEVGRLIEAAAGDVLVMRPRLAHCSGVSAPDCSSHRRIVHLELAPTPTLPEGFRWRTYLPLGTSETPAC